MGPKLQRMTSQYGGTGLMYRTYRSVRYRVDVVRNLPRCPVRVSVLYRCRYRLPYRRPYRYRSTGIDVVPHLPKCAIPVLMSYRTYRSVWFRHRYCTDIGTVSGTDAHTGTGGAGIDVVPNLPQCPVPALMYRTYRSVRYRYRCTEVPGTDIDAVPNVPNCLVPV